MGNKVKFNLKNVHAAKLTEKEEGGSTKFEYGVPKAIPGAVSISLDAEGESSIQLYADGIVYFRSVTNNGYSERLFRNGVDSGMALEQKSCRKNWMQRECW